MIIIKKGKAASDNKNQDSVYSGRREEEIVIKMENIGLWGASL